MRHTILYFFLIPLQIFASPVLSPSLPAVHTKGVFYCDSCNWWSIRGGFRGDYVFDRKMQNSFLTLDPFQFFANEGVFTLNLWNWVDLYTFCGIANQNISFNRAGSDEVIAYEAKTIWGIGARSLLFQTDLGCCGITYCGVDFNYESILTAEPNIATLDGSPITEEFFSVFREWQISLQLGQQIKCFIPYVAIKWSSAREEDKLGSIYRGDLHFGYAVGTSFIDNGRISVTAEARFIDEKAASLEAEFRF